MAQRPSPVKRNAAFFKPMKTCAKERRRHATAGHPMTLKASCDLSVPEPEALIDRFCHHYAEHGRIRRDGGAAHVAIAFGTFSMVPIVGGIRVDTQARDDSNLTYMKMGVVNHLREFLGAGAPPVRWDGDGERAGGTPAFWRTMRVVESRDVTPAMRRIVLAGPDLRRFATGALHVRLFFPKAGRALEGPVLGDDGCPIWPEGPDALVPRVYTIRAIDPALGRVSIDILRHDGDATPGSAFAANARAGDVVGMMGPLGDNGLPASRRLFLFGDETAIPAIDRIVRRLPASAEAHVVVEVANALEEQPFETPARARTLWLHRDAGAGSLADHAARLDAQALGEDGYVWAGCEFADFVAIRRHCRKVLGLTRERHHVVAYWRRGGDVG